MDFAVSFRPVPRMSLWLMLRLLIALSFGYFETLNRAADKGRIEREILRLRSFNNLVLDEHHVYKSVYVDWADEVLELLKMLAESSFSTDCGAKLKLAFNDPMRGPDILQYFRVSRHTAVLA